MMFSFSRRANMLFSFINFDSFYYINSRDNKEYFKNVTKFEDKDVVKYRVKISYENGEEIEHSFYMSMKAFDRALKDLITPNNSEYFFKHEPDKRIIEPNSAAFTPPKFKTK